LNIVQVGKMIKLITIKIDDDKTEQEVLNCLKPSLILHFKGAEVEITGKDRTIKYKEDLNKVIN